MRGNAILAAAVFVAITAACETSPGPTPPTIVIGADLPLSGDPSETTTLAHAIELAIDQHPYIGSFRLKLMLLDDSLGAGASPMLGVQNIKLMVADPRVMGVVGPYNSYVARDEIVRANPVNLVLLSPSATQACLTAAPSFCNDRLKALHASRPNNFFRIAPPDARQGTAMGRFAARLGIKDVAVLNESGNTGTLGIAQSFDAEFVALGGEVVWEQELARGTKDFTGFLKSAKAAGARAIYAVGDYSGGICEVGVQMRSDFAYLLTWDGATANDKCFAGKVAPTTQVYGTFADVDPTHSSDATVQKVVRAYMKAYPQDKQVADYTFAAYDCTLILIEAITRVVESNRGGAPTRAKVLDAVTHGHFVHGVTGMYDFGPYGDAISPLMSMWTVQDGHWVYLRRVDASATPT